ncbi:caspase-14 [Drosophila subpulchrella]|uniref:caspase-14 n=1 Tax=Drosophila subpulchrella TaxID=1486046 RepID=UPI0018A181B5|nr:caspase-14 [Drosophila subpulchrella]
MANDCGDSDKRFQPASMYFKLDSAMMVDRDSDSATADNEVSKPFESASMFFPVDAQGVIQLKLLPPLVCILHHVDFKNNPGKRREGSSQDVEALKKTFGSLKCQIIEVPNPTLAVVKEKVAELALKEFDQLSGLVIIILSHGERKEKIESCDGQMYDLDDDVLFPLRDNSTLKGKPKILIVQACKNKRLEADSSRIEPDHSYYMKCYSTTEGMKSYRDPVEGSIFIQTLCTAMDQHALTKDFKVIMEEVNAMVEIESARTGYRQVPALLFSPWTPYCFGDYELHLQLQLQQSGNKTQYEMLCGLPNCLYEGVPRSCGQQPVHK